MSKVKVKMLMDLTGEVLEHSYELSKGEVVEVEGKGEGEYSLLIGDEEIWLKEGKDVELVESNKTNKEMGNMVSIKLENINVVAGEELLSFVEGAKLVENNVEEINYSNINDLNRHLGTDKVSKLRKLLDAKKKEVEKEMNKPRKYVRTVEDFTINLEDAEGISLATGIKLIKAGIEEITPENKDSVVELIGEDAFNKLLPQSDEKRETLWVKDKEVIAYMKEGLNITVGSKVISSFGIKEVNDKSSKEFTGTLNNGEYTFFVNQNGTVDVIGSKPLDLRDNKVYEYVNLLRNVVTELQIEYVEFLNELDIENFEEVKKETSMA